MPHRQPETAGDPGAGILDVRHLGAEGVERYLRRHGLGASKRYSQNHLVDGEVLEAIVEAAAPAGRSVLEIGPGIGILSGALLAAGAARVSAVEVDRRLAGHLRERFASDPRFVLTETDILDADVATLVEPPYDLVANLPYHITSPVLHQALGQQPRPEHFVLMLQREVAERITSPPGGLSYLSVFVQYHAAVSLLRIVPASAFEPAPQVESAVVVGTVRPRRLGEEDEESLWRLVQAGFRERRKMLHNVLVRQLPLVGRERVAGALAAAGIAPDRRPQTVSVDEWLSLAAAIGPLS
ncbi:MAG: 16S rRNA (adenine(1518)-N(6)/adenine(1519)-N(6))-dimethyltransferase RsmA [Chloroflexota bacterium]|nr:16S rRNA (adenine(1518)-N(6)/adenine(1519)-N(6))-dimethyltransferase RsmA [Chloroflexota bacterium]